MMNKIVLFKALILTNYLFFIQAQVINFNTPANDDGEGAIVYLDRHDVECPVSHVLQGFDVFRPTDRTISIKYRCIRLQTLTDGVGDYSASTGWTNDFNNLISRKFSADRIQHIPVACNNNYALKSFKLESRTTLFTEIRFKYVCTPLKMINCSSDSTSERDCYDGQNFTLSNVGFFLGSFNVLTGFKLDVSYYFRWFNFEGRRFRMNYSFCEARDISKEINDYNLTKPKLPANNYLRNLETKEINENGLVNSVSITSAVSVNEKINT